MYTEFWWGNCLEIVQLEDKERDSRTALWCVLVRYIVRARVDRTGSGQCPVTDLGVSGVEPSDNSSGLMRWKIIPSQGKVRRIRIRIFLRAS
jgi:hypothetical protein